MMNSKILKVSCALENIDVRYIEEALCFDRRDEKSHKGRIITFPKMSAACIVLLILLGLTAAAFALSRMAISWRDIFDPDQDIINDADEILVDSVQIKNTIESHDFGSEGAKEVLPAYGAFDEKIEPENLEIDIVKAISDERTLYLLYSVRANDGTVLDAGGRFRSFDMLFSGKMMSGAYQQYFIERHEGVPKNELEGVIYADWQYDLSAGKLVLDFADWQEEKQFDDAAVNVDVAAIVAESENNLNLPILFTGHRPEYLLQPGNLNIDLPYGDISICSAGWEDGVLQIVMKGPKSAAEWSTGQNWYFVDTRTNEFIIPEQSAYYHIPEELGYSLETSDRCFFWNFVLVDEDALPYLEMHWGGTSCFETVLSGKWEVAVSETPLTVKSELLAENVELDYFGNVIIARKIECSKLSLAVYFDGIIDSTAGILSLFKVFDVNGNLLDCDWGFTADPDADGCMVWTRFKEPVDPENICRITFKDETIFIR